MFSTTCNVFCPQHCNETTPSNSSDNTVTPSQFSSCSVPLQHYKLLNIFSWWKIFFSLKVDSKLSWFSFTLLINMDKVSLPQTCFSIYSLQIFSKISPQINFLYKYIFPILCQYPFFKDSGLYFHLSSRYLFIHTISWYLSFMHLKLN